MGCSCGGHNGGTNPLSPIIEDLRARAESLGGGGPAPEPCIAYPPGATEGQKLCMDQACAIYLIRWIGCANKFDPALCRQLIFEDYQEEVAGCLGEQA